MRLQFGLTSDLTDTRYAPLAALAAYYKAENVLAPLQSVTSASKTGDFNLPEKLTQVILSVLAGCQYISMVNTKLRPERGLAQVERIDRFADQSTLARALNELSRLNLSQLRAAVRQISNSCSRTQQHDWRGFLQLDFDLSALPCGKQAEGGKKGYASGKKTALCAN